MEHLFDLEKTIDMMSSHLKEDGLIFIEVPDASSYSAGRVFDFFWLAMREHINHFDSFHLEMLMTKYGFKKEYMLQSLVSCDDHYSYPSLIMLFRKTNDKCSEISYSPYLTESIKKHILKEEVFLNYKKKKIDELILSQQELYIWGVASEFFILYSLTDLRRCNIKCLVDKNPVKQANNFDGIKICPPEFLKGIPHDSAILISSVFRESDMLDYLNEINYKGDIILFNEKI